MRRIQRCFSREGTKLDPNVSGTMWGKAGNYRSSILIYFRGILIESYDMVRGIVYVVASIAAPEDSEEWPTSYIRGAQGLEAAVRAVTIRSGSQLQYAENGIRTLTDTQLHPAKTT